MATDDETTGLVIHLFGPPPAVDGAPSVEYGGRMCYPHSPVVHQLQRTVTCKRCKEQLDPIDVLQQIAHRHDDWVRLLEETTKLRAQVESLKLEEKRVKARLKGISNKDARAAVAEEQRKWEATRERSIHNVREAVILLERVNRALLARGKPIPVPRADSIDATGEQDVG